ncbi:MAG TPA: phosphoglycerate kinase [Luteibaculaceae bacterium]|nr:phosphoglycerate kinase [Luteibaculaceae bacterium]
MMSIDQFSFAGKKALVRVDFNVPMDAQFNITDDTRIKAALPTIQKIISDGGVAILMSHLGRPKGADASLSLSHLVSHLGKLLGKSIHFAPDCIGSEAERICQSAQAGDVVLLENLRFYSEEEKGDAEFAQKLASLGDVYVNDAFGTAHRAHASTAVMAQYFPGRKLFGYLMEAEVNSIDKVLNSGESPVTAIIGGAKVSSKITIIENMLSKVNHLIIGGGMAYTFITARGGKTGNSLVEPDKMQLALSLMEKAEQMGVQLHLPTDTLIADQFSNDAQTQICAIDQIPDGWLGLDIGPETIETYTRVITSSKTILWNGPMGVFEMSNFSGGTIAVAKALVEATQKHAAFTLVGGGDSVAAINQFNLGDQVSYVSTGGGAMLESLEGIVLPGIAAVLEKA